MSQYLAIFFHRRSRSQGGVLVRADGTVGVADQQPNHYQRDHSCLWQPREYCCFFGLAGKVGNKIYHHIVIQLHSCHPSLVCSGAIYCVGQLLAHMAMTCRVPTVIHDHKPSIHVAPAHPLRTEQPIGRKRRKKENQSKMATGVSVLLTSH